jgi:integrase
MRNPNPEIDDLANQDPPLRRRQRRKTLTDRMVAALPHKRKRYIVADPEQRGMYVRVPPEGPAVFVTVARDVYAKQIWTTLGTADVLKIEDARQQARERIRRIKAGLPPVEPLAPKPDSFKSVAEDWLKRYATKQRLITLREIQRALRVYVIPHWGERVFTSLGKVDLAKLLDHVEDHHGSRMADVVAGYIRGIASWYAERSDTYVNPFLRLKKRARNEARARILSDDEIRRVWRACEQAGAFGRFFMLLLLTAQRRSALAKMTFDAIDADGTWHMPRAEREKNNAGDLKLPSLALEIIAQQPKMASNDYVFPSHQGRGAICAFRDRKMSLDNASGVKNWVLHDARRTARSLLSRIGIASEICERVLGHRVGSSVAQIYDRHQYFEEKAIALAKLAQLVKQIVHGEPGGNVVTMRTPAQVQP